jgi:pimeloyl-ACP methyl ester carboxylesterase
MNRVFFYSILLLIGITFIAFLVSYPMCKKQISKAIEKIAAQSTVLMTEFGVMEYAIRGEGKPILLIHGAGGGFDQGLWLGEICLDSDYQFIAPSKFGYLKSALPNNSSIQMQAEQYKVLLEHLNIKKVSVIGVSAGGPSAMQFASNYPEMVDKLILLSAVSMPPNSSDKDPFSIKVIHTIQKSDYLYWVFTNVFESQILSLMGIPPNDYKNFSPKHKALARQMLDDMHPMSQRYKGTIADGLMIQDFKIPLNIASPTLIIHSRNDGLVSYTHGEHANKNIKGSKIIIYENGGHGALSELDNLRKEIRLFLN